MSDKEKLLEQQNMTISANNQTSLKSPKDKQSILFTKTGSVVSVSENTPSSSIKNWSSNSLNKNSLVRASSMDKNESPGSDMDSSDSKQLNYYLESENSQKIYNNTLKVTYLNGYDGARPPTARSLPAKVQNEENEIMISQNLSQPNGAKYIKNPSCPTISQSQTKLINVVCKNNELDDSISDKKPNGSVKTSNNRLQIDSKPQLKLSKSANDTFSDTNTSTRAKSNLDYFLDYTLNPFTTKFELIGNKQTKKPNEANKNDGYQPFAYPRSQSISNLNDNRKPIEDIISPNHVKPYTTSTVYNYVIPNDQAMKKKANGHHDNDSTSNLYRQFSPQPGSYNNEYLNFIYTKTSISDEKLDETNFSNRYGTYNLANEDERSKKSFLRITDQLFTGNLGSIKNERKMCRLGIEYLIDMTNMRPDDLNRQTLGKLPCLCKRQHSRLYLTLEITDTSFKSLFNAFSEVNKFIQRARKSNFSKGVLIFGKSVIDQQVICACAQFLMVEYEISLDKALQVILEKIPHINKIKMDKCYLDYLKQFECYLNHMSSTIPNKQAQSMEKNENKKTKTSNNKSETTSSSASSKSNAQAVFYDFSNTDFNEDLDEDESNAIQFDDDGIRDNFERNSSKKLTKFREVNEEEEEEEEANDEKNNKYKNKNFKMAWM